MLSKNVPSTEIFKSLSIGLPTLSALCCFAITMIVAPPDLKAEAKKSGQVSCKAAGPQSPRDVTKSKGSNAIKFDVAPPASKLNLCDIHFHKFAEHRASGYTQLTGKDNHRGYICNGKTPKMSKSDANSDHHNNKSSCHGITTGDTVEVHWVYTSCDVKPGPTLGSCFSPTCKTPQLRVEARVFYLSDDKSAGSFADYSTRKAANGNPPSAQAPVEYIGATTGDKYNDGTCSPYNVTWRVSSECSALNLQSLNNWCAKNEFNEDHAHGVRSLVEKEHLLSPIN